MEKSDHWNLGLALKQEDQFQNDSLRLVCFRDQQAEFFLFKPINTLSAILFSQSMSPKG